MPAAIVTYYPADTGKNADGSAYGGNRIAAHPRFQTGARVKITVRRRAKRRARPVVRWRVYVVCDRGDLATNQFDLPVAEFAYLVGPGWRAQGKVTARYEIVGRARKAKRSGGVKRR